MWLYCIWMYQKNCTLYITQIHCYYKCKYTQNRKNVDIPWARWRMFWGRRPPPLSADMCRSRLRKCTHSPLIKKFWDLNKNFFESWEKHSNSEQICALNCHVTVANCYATVPHCHMAVPHCKMTVPHCQMTVPQTVKRLCHTVRWLCPKLSSDCATLSDDCAPMSHDLAEGKQIYLSIDFLRKKFSYSGRMIFR